MKLIKRAASAVLCLFLAAALTGCVTKPAEDFYCLPQLSEGYLQLQKKIDAIAASGAEYSAPQSGSHRQAVQLEDLDGDGIKEAIAFFSVSGSDKPQKIYIFRNIDGRYEEAARIEGEGSSIGSVNYADMNGDGVKELMVGWQIAAGIRMLTVYSIKGYRVSTLVSTDYTEYTVADLSEDGMSDVIVLRLSASEPAGEAELFTLTGDGEIVTSTARLSAGAEGLLRVRAGMLSDQRRAIYVESTINGSGIVTDILTCRGGAIRNVTLDDTAGVSRDTVRTYAVYCRDIDGDGTLDVPYLVPLPTQGDEAKYYIVEWYSYSSLGRTKLVSTTYSNYSDSWYLVLPEGWSGSISVRREDEVAGERAIIFSYVNSMGSSEDFLAIYTLSGDNRAERAVAGKRFVIQSEEETVYAGELLRNPAGFALRLSEELVRANFHEIYSEWITGEM